MATDITYVQDAANRTNKVYWEGEIQKMASLGQEVTHFLEVLAKKECGDKSSEAKVQEMGDKVAQTFVNHLDRDEELGSYLEKMSEPLEYQFPQTIGDIYHLKEDMGTVKEQEFDDEWCNDDWRDDRWWIQGRRSCFE